MANQKNPFFSLEDFKKFEIVITGKNMTSQIPIPGGPSSIQLIEIHEDGISIELPQKSCSMGHTLSLEVTINQLKINILGVIEELDRNATSTLSSRLKFRQYDQEAWRNFLNQLSGKQMSINTLIRNTRK